jgi:UDP-glucose:(heptosyl)LPS alpha-1,3-glucosyltransferase
MNIALVTMRTDPARGGAERYTVDLAAALRSRGHDVALLASTFGGVPSGVRSVPLDARGVTRVKRYDRFLDALDAHLGDNAYDVVHAMLPVRTCDVYHPHAGIARATTARDSRLTKLLNRRRARVAAVEGALLESASPPVVLCLSEYVRSAVRRWYSLDESRLPIAFNGVDTTRFNPAIRPGSRAEARASFGFGDDQSVALFVGQDFERKGLREAVLAVGALSGSSPAADDMLLLVVGKQRAAKYLSLAKRLSIHPRVINAGTTPDPYRAYRAADFFVLPTRHDPCSLVVLEALAMGLPVISTRFNGATEVMTDGIHGFVLSDPGDVPALASAMRRLLDPALRRRMSEACLRLRPKLAYEHHLETVLDVYRQVVARKASPRPAAAAEPQQDIAPEDWREEERRRDRA